MDNAEQQIRANLKRIAAEHGPDMIFDATVLAVDEENYLCDIELDPEGTIYDCRLRALATGNKSIDVLPAVGSAVVVAKITDDEYLVLVCDEISKYRITVNNITVQVDAGGVTIGNGTETLKQIMDDLVDQILLIYASKDVAALTLIKTRINNLLK